MLIGSTACQKQAAPALIPSGQVSAVIGNELSTQLDKYLSEIQFNGAVLIAGNGKVIVNKGYGMADFERQSVNVPDTVFRIGSLTKSFTAMAVMLLVDKGMVKTDDPLQTYIPEFTNRTITIHHLLTHSSGLPRNDPNMGGSDAGMLSRYGSWTLSFPPGSKFQYSNVGYELLRVLIEKRTGQPYTKYVEEQILKPLGMLHTGYDNMGYTPIGGRAMGYAGTMANHHLVPYYEATPAAGAMYSTVNDLYLWDQALRDNRLVKKETLSSMFTPYIRADEPRWSYGYGWMVQTVADNRKIVMHSGYIEPFTSQITRYVDDQMVCIVLSNFNIDIEAITNRLEKLFLPNT